MALNDEFVALLVILEYLNSYLHECCRISNKLMLVTIMEFKSEKYLLFNVILDYSYRDNISMNYQIRFLILRTVLFHFFMEPGGEGNIFFI